MYSSLHKIDIVAEKDGKRLYLQTDHRSPEEIEAELELTVLFGLTRIILAQRVSAREGVEGSVRYFAKGGVHPKIAELVAATGAELEPIPEGIFVDASSLPKREPAEMADEAFAGLAKRVVAREKLELDEEGLALFVEHCEDCPSLEDDEIAYWTTVTELAAVAGETLRASFGGRWVDDPGDYSPIPFMFACGDGLVNVVGKATRFLEHGEAQSPVHLLRAMRDAQVEEGPLLPNLKPSRWDGAQIVVSGPLVPSLATIGADMPLVAYGHDKPNTFSMMKRDGKRELEMASFREQAIENLAKISVEVEEVHLSGLGISFLAVSESFFAAEKILDFAFMESLQARLQVPVVLAAIPQKGRMLVMSGLAEALEQNAFLALARSMFEENEGGAAITPTVFVVSDGVIQGVVESEDGGPEPTEA